MDRRRFLKLAGAAVPGIATTRALAGMPQGSASAAATSRLAQSTWRPNYGPNPDPSLRPAPVTRRLLVVINNPRLRSQGNVRLHTHFRWNNPDFLVTNHIRDLNHASFGYVNYEVAERVQVDDFSGFPITHDGFRHDENSYLAAVRNRQEPSSGVNYHAYLDQHQIIDRVSSGRIDEVWDMGVGYVGMWEALMAGPGASNSNAPPLGGTDHAGRRFVIMAYNYSRSLAEMLHSYGHRAEGHLNTVHSRFSDQDNLWRRFIRYDLTHPGQAEVGNIHYPPNGVRDYDKSNPRVVMSNCDDWYHFPFLTGNRFRPISSGEWNGDSRLYYMWWLRHLPHVAGECDGVALNWWRYVVDPNTI